MSFTVLFAALAFLALVAIFGGTYALKGWKIAFIATGIAFVLLALLLAGLVFVIVNSMPN
ncbi:MAG TPA: hypothetical protein VFY26_19130 [Anaerolineales bacterium]|nr:hypothetical protein [Anaerolineales bacterium]